MYCSVKLIYVIQVLEKSLLPVRYSFEGVVVYVNDNNDNVEYEGGDEYHDEDDHDDDEGDELSDVRLHEERGRRVTGDARPQGQVITPVSDHQL